MDLDRPWALHPQVAVRPEPFGALVYHFGTRKLSFLKDRRLLDVVNGLGGAPSARVALADAGVTAAEVPTFAAALHALVASKMLEERIA